MTHTGSKTPLVIVYHADCIDGAACAWGVAKAAGSDYNKRTPDPNVTYIPYEHHNVDDAQKQIRAALTPQTQVYFADVAPTPAFLNELMTPTAEGTAKIKSVHVLDHHASAADALKDYKPPAIKTGDTAPALEIKIDPGRSSAARMVWEHLLPDTPVPPVFDLINKMDGNAAGLKTPQDFSAAALADTFDISTTNKALHTIRNLARMTFNDMAAHGRHLSHDQDGKIKKLLETANMVTLQILPGQPPVQVPVVNGDVKQYGRKVSSSLVALAEKTGAPAAFAWFMQENGTVSMSIRTNGEPDAAKIAAHLRDTMGATGGGHANAGAVHFASLFEFARQMPFDQSAQKPPVQKAAPPAKKPPRHKYN